MILHVRLRDANARGPTVDTALDALEQEPLPPESPLVGIPNLFLSPHLGGNVPSYFALVQELFLRDMAHYVRGERMERVVNKRRGYQG